MTIICFCHWQYLGDIEEHLGITIDQIGPEMKVPVNEFDGKVVYGERRKLTGKEERFFLSHQRTSVHFVFSKGGMSHWV